MKIVILDGYTANSGDLSWKELEKYGELTVYDRTPADKVVERCAGAEVVLTNKVVLTDEVMAHLPELRYISVMATGYNVVDIEAARRRGIVVTNVPAYSTASVAQLVFAHLLNIAQQVQYHNLAVKSGRWSSCQDFCFQATPLMELSGKTMGIVGFGGIGSAVAKIALAMGMKVAAFTSKEQSALPEGVAKVTLDELFSQSDVVSLHCPLTEGTRHLVNAERLTAMKSNAILINTGRGPLVDEKALAQALRSGAIAAACLDVLSQEPPEADNPLFALKNCYITPHIAWATREARARLIDTLVKNLEGYATGNVINNVAK